MNYCPSCGSLVEKIGIGDSCDTYYQCQNSECGKSFCLSYTWEGNDYSIREVNKSDLNTLTLPPEISAMAALAEPSKVSQDSEILKEAETMLAKSKLQAQALQKIENQRLSTFRKD